MNSILYISLPTKPPSFKAKLLALARQLLKEQVGDEVTIERLDQDELWLEVVAIKYQ